MPLGVIAVKIVLARPDFVHGPDDRVQGHVQLKWLPESSGRNPPVRELLVPQCKLAITFGGRLKTKMRKGGHSHTDTFRGRLPIFSRSEPVHDDRLTITQGEVLQFPFSLAFPKRPDPPPRVMGEDPWEKHRLFHEPSHLPSSFSEHDDGLYTSFDCFCQYTITPTIRVPGIDVETYVGVDKAAFYPVIYKAPVLVPPAERTPRARAFVETIDIQNEQLLSEEHQPKGFREKMKFKLSSSNKPTYRARVKVSVPEYLTIGEGITFEVDVEPLEFSTAEIAPEIWMTQYSILLTGITNVRAEKYLFTEVEGDKFDDRIARFMGRSSELFSKKEEWKKTITTAPLKEISPTFTTQIIARRYRMETNIVIVCAGETVYLKRSYDVTVLPADTTGSTAREEVVAGHSEALPSYNPPPAYEEEDNTDHPPKGDSVENIKERQDA